MDNSQYAALLDETADLLQVTGANAFKVRAFQRASRTVKGLSQPVGQLIDDGTITDVDGIGKSIATDLQHIRETGTTPALDELRASLPDGITDLLAVQGLGPKRVKKIYEELGVGSLEELQEVAESGQLASLSGLGKKTAEKVLVEIERLKKSRGRTPYSRALPVARQIVAMLEARDDVEMVEAAGSLRRGRETVGDLDFVVGAEKSADIMQAFRDMQDVEEVVASGETKTTVYLRGGLSADLRVVPPEVFGATLHHFTGSKDHNVMMRSRAQKRGLRISEWGVFKVDGDSEERIACTSESDVFAAVDLPFIPPELREGLGEIRAAEGGDLPELIELSDILSDLHMHTTASDGNQSVADMADSAAEHGYDFIAITDHSAALTVANGLDADRVAEQCDEIDAFNEGGHSVRVLKGLEVDIMKDGELDLDPQTLERLDWVVASVHQWMNMGEEEMTERVVRAVRSGLVSALGHPTGRLIGRRDPFAMDYDRVFDACAECGVAVEVNGSPNRLDLNDQHLRRALERDDLWVTINTDAHSTRTLNQMHFGVRMARRGWTPKGRVLNALSLDAFLKARRKPERA